MKALSLFDWLLATTLVLNAFAVAGLAWVFHRPFMATRRLPGYVPLHMKLGPYLRTVTVIGSLSLGATLAIAYGLGHYVFATKPIGVGRALLQAAAIFVVYDFSYYFLHRSMHYPPIMRVVHRKHHKARFPTAAESLVQHPAELLSGLGLLALSTWSVFAVFGPVSPYAFLAIFFVYSMTNIFIHSGLELPSKLMWPVNFLTKKHYVHHKDFTYNFASMSPLPDIVFGTARAYDESAARVAGSSSQVGLNRQPLR